MSRVVRFPGFARAFGRRGSRTRDQPQVRAERHDPPTSAIYSGDSVIAFDMPECGARSWGFPLDRRYDHVAVDADENRSKIQASEGFLVPRRKGCASERSGARNHTADEAICRKGPGCALKLVDRCCAKRLPGSDRGGRRAAMTRRDRTSLWTAPGPRLTELTLPRAGAAQL